MKVIGLVKELIKGIPGIEYFFNFHKETGGTNNARYCYSVWLRHLVIAYENGLKSVPKKIAELGPGDSIGMGLSALISGSENYHALDIINYCDTDRNLKIFDDLVALFKNKTPIPGGIEFPKLKPILERYDFPEHIFTTDYLEKILDSSRLQKIRNSISQIDSPNISGENNMIRYRVPWNDAKVIEVDSIDMIMSQAVLQHIDNLAEAYQCMYKWLKPNGIISHSIDLKSMGTSDRWDGHWAYSDFKWKIIRGRRSFLINREPYSTHIRLLRNSGFNIVCDKKSISESTFGNNKKLSARFKKLSAEDLTVSGTFIQAIK